jgi:hypothetical protein
MQLVLETLLKQQSLLDISITFESMPMLRLLNPIFVLVISDVDNVKSDIICKLYPFYECNNP